MGEGTGAGIVISCCGDVGCRVYDGGSDVREEPDWARTGTTIARETLSIAVTIAATPPGRTAHSHGRIVWRCAGAAALTLH